MPSVLSNALLSCRKLKSLNVIGCSGVTLDIVVHLLQNNPELTKLGWTVSGTLPDIILLNMETFKQLKSLHFCIHGTQSDIGKDFCFIPSLPVSELCYTVRSGIAEPIIIHLQAGEGCESLASALKNHPVHLRSFFSNSDLLLESGSIYKAINFGINSEIITTDVAGIRSIVMLNSLRYLSLTGQSGVTADLLKDVAVGCSGLETLSLRCCRNCLVPVGTCCSNLLFKAQLS